MIQSLLVILISLTARAQNSAPSVWTQMQLKNINQLEVFLESLEIQGTEVLVGFRVDGQTQQLSLCRDVKNEPFYGSVYQNQTVEILRSALKSKDSVQFGVSGPWSPCLQSVKISKAQ